MYNYLDIIQEGVLRALSYGYLTPDRIINPPQRAALQAYARFLSASSDDERKRAYFDMATGTGKTGLFSIIIRHAYQVAQERGLGDTFKAIVVEPTTILLKQTKDELAVIAPNLKNAIGVYGGRSKDSSQPITVMTYDAWVELAEGGQLPLDKLALNINDEAHYGLSDRRRNIFDTHLSDTIHLAVTATSKFDADKTIELTHRNLMYEISLREAVEQGYLAEYAHVQYAVMRLLPSLTEDRQLDKRETASLRRREWSTFVTRAYATMRDGINNELLSDKIAVFFAANTGHADDLAHMLNHNPILLKKAHEGGFESVATSIHSVGLADREQEKRLADFKSGRYMAAVGDQKFKEGFDYPRVKLEAGFPGASLVDTVQEMGRASRRYIDPITGISQGAVYLSAVPYIGDLSDPMADEKSRLLALANSVTALDVLKGSTVFGPASIIRSTEPTRTPSSHFMLSPTCEVSVFTSEEETLTVSKQIESARQKEYPEKEADWVSGADLNKTCVGSVYAFNHLFQSYGEKKIKLLIKQGMDAEDAARLVDKKWTGMRLSTAGQPVFYGSPALIVELLEKGDLRLLTSKATTKEATWMSGGDMAAIYVGGGAKFNKLFQEYADGKRLVLIKEGASPEEATTILDQRYVGLRTAGPNEVLCASPEVIDEIIKKHSLRLIASKLPKRERDWMSGNEIKAKYIGSFKKFQELLEASLQRKIQELIDNGAKESEATAVVDQEYIGKRSNGTAEVLCASPSMIAELINKGELRARDQAALVREEGWINGNEMMSNYIGAANTLTDLLKSYAETKRDVLIKDGTSLGEAVELVEKKFVGIRKNHKGKEALYASPEVIAELQQNGELRLRSTKAPAKKDWLSTGDMLSSYVGATNRIFVQILEAYAQDKNQELVEQGLTNEAAATLVDKQFVGLRASTGRETLCASPQAIAELTERGILHTQAPKKGNWLSPSDLIASYSGRSRGTFTQILQGYADEKIAALVEQGMPPVEAAEVVNQQFVGLRSGNSGISTVAASPEVIEELVRMERLCPLIPRKRGREATRPVEDENIGVKQAKTADRA